MAKNKWAVIEPVHKHKLRIMGASINDTTLIFACVNCKQILIYRKVGIINMLLHGKKFRKRWRTS